MRQPQWMLAHDDGGGGAPGELQSRVGVGCGHDFVARVSQEQGEDRPHVAVGVDDEDHRWSARWGEQKPPEETLRRLTSAVDPR